MSTTLILLSTAAERLEALRSAIGDSVSAIRQRRKQAGLSVREVAEIAAVSHSWLDKQERGAAVASPLRLEAVLRKLEEHTNHSALVEMHLAAAGRCRQRGTSTDCWTMPSSTSWTTENW